MWTPEQFFRRSRAVFVLLLGLLLLVAAHAWLVAAQDSQAPSPLIALPLPLDARPANGAIQGTQLLTAFPVLNTGKVVVNAFRITQTTLKIGSKTIPGAIVGGTATINPGVKGASYGSFPSASLVPGTPTLTIVGSCNVSGAVLKFTLETPLHIAPKSPGSATAGSSTATVTRVLAGPYPGPALEPKEANEDEDAPLVPTGPIHPLAISPAVAIVPAPAVAVDPAGLQVYSQLTAFVGLQNGIPVEPSGATAATAGDVVLVVSNTGEAFSINGGATWNFLTPGGSKGMFPATRR
jgi:hypothetical protein